MRCQQCNKKIGMLGIECKCKNVYCSGCRYAENHDCKFDYVNEERKILEKNNPPIKSEKITKI